VHIGNSDPGTHLFGCTATISARCNQECMAKTQPQSYKEDSAFFLYMVSPRPQKCSLVVGQIQNLAMLQPVLLLIRKVDLEHLRSARGHQATPRR
jgi:hypothetical protein